MCFIHLSPFYALSLLKKISTRKNEEHRQALNEGKQWHIPFWPDLEEKFWFLSYRHFIDSPYHYRIAPPLGALKNQDNDICQLFMLSKNSFSDSSPHESLFLAKTRIVHCIVGIPLNGFSIQVLHPQVIWLNLACVCYPEIMHSIELWLFVDLYLYVMHYVRVVHALFHSVHTTFEVGFIISNSHF